MNKKIVKDPLFLFGISVIVYTFCGILLVVIVPKHYVTPVTLLWSLPFILYYIFATINFYRKERKNND